MLCYHDFLTDVARYAASGTNNDFPELTCCPICRARNRLSRHGFYERNAIEGNNVFRIPICRLRCPDCGKTVSILPVFLLPYFQHTTDTIIRILLAWWLSCLLLCSRQLRRFYERRMFGKQTEIELFFRSEDVSEVFPEKGIDRATKMLQMIQSLGNATFVRRWWIHQIHNFMAAPIYRGTPVARTG